MDRCKISKWEVELGAQDRVNIPASCMTPTSAKSDVKMTNN